MLPTLEKEVEISASALDLQKRKCTSVPFERTSVLRNKLRESGTLLATGILTKLAAEELLRVFLTIETG